MIFLIRLLSAISLFALLGRANTILDTASNIILVVGYRLLLLSAPFIHNLLNRKSAAVSFAFSSLGVLIILAEYPCTMIIGTLSIATGLSVGGFLIKSLASETPEGAGLNKIAINAGSMISGSLIVWLSSRNSFLITTFLILFVCTILSFFANKTSADIKPMIFKQTEISVYFAWLLIGITIGIKLYSIFVILPQSLIDSFGTLPEWYGLSISINGFTIILLQLPIIRFLKVNDLYARKITFFSLAIGMLLIAFCNKHFVNYIYTAILWTFLCSIIECIASYLDSLASANNSLFFKEIAAGIGAGISVGIMRYGNAESSSIVIAIIGGACLILGFIILDNYSKKVAML